MSIEYTLKRSNRKTLSIVVKNNAAVEVRSPLKTPQCEIDKFVSSHQSWIENNIAKMKASMGDEIDIGSTLPFLGKEMPIIKKNINKALICEEGILLPLTVKTEQISPTIIALLKKEAKDYITSRVKSIAQSMKIQYASVMINQAHTHWGSCTADRLHFSCFLMMADKETIDYVVTHELAHITHHNHSKNFWALVAKHCPNYIKLRANLKPLGIRANRLIQK